MSKQNDDISSKIKAAFAKQSEANCENYHEGQMLLTRFEKAWAPLFDHMKKLADELKLSKDKKRLNIRLELDQQMCVSMFFELSELNPAMGEDYWTRIDFRAFYNEMEKGSCFITRFKDSFNKSKYENKSPDLALENLSGVQHLDKEGKRHFIHPDDMDAAQEYLEDWLITQAAFGFDQSRLYPKSTHEITSEPTKPGPGNTPS
ncbi:MAG TPA: hypothetical protein VIF12_07580 [Micavibrio sp.]